MFMKASKKRARLRLALIGPAGSGKTMTALRVARGLAGPDGRIAVLDSEAGSASKYAVPGSMDFDVVEPDSFAPERYIEVIAAAAKAKYDVLVIDSLSHAWMGKDGILADVDKAAKRSSKGDSFGAWRDATPRQVALIDAIVRAPLHIVCTIRSKVEHILEKDERTGKMAPRKVGLQPVQRDGLEYEFDVVGDIDDLHVLRITKSRFSDIADSDIAKPGEAFGEKLRSWLDDGVAPPPPPKPETTDAGWKAIHAAIQGLDDAETLDDVRGSSRMFKTYLEGDGKAQVAESELAAMRAYFKSATDRVRGSSSTYSDDELALVEMLAAAHQRVLVEAERNVDPPPPAAPETSAGKEPDEVIP